jgi:predicted RNase H-like nuclease (RuvC/YqgF family)
MARRTIEAIKRHCYFTGATDDEIVSHMAKVVESWAKEIAAAKAENDKIRKQSWWRRPTQQSHLRQEVIAAKAENERLRTKLTEIVQEYRFSGGVSDEVSDAAEILQELGVDLEAREKEGA